MASLRRLQLTADTPSIGGPGNRARSARQPRRASPGAANPGGRCGPRRTEHQHDNTTGLRPVGRRMRHRSSGDRSRAVGTGGTIGRAGRSRHLGPLYRNLGRDRPTGLGRAGRLHGGRSGNMAGTPGRRSGRPRVAGRAQLRRAAAFSLASPSRGHVPHRLSARIRRRRADGDRRWLVLRAVPGARRPGQCRDRARREQAAIRTAWRPPSRAACAGDPRGGSRRWVRDLPLCRSSTASLSPFRWRIASAAVPARGSCWSVMRAASSIRSVARGSPGHSVRPIGRPWPSPGTCKMRTPLPSPTTIGVCATGSTGRTPSRGSSKRSSLDRTLSPTPFDDSKGDHTCAKHSLAVMADLRPPEDALDPRYLVGLLRP